MLSAPRPIAYCSSRSTPRSLSSPTAIAAHPRTLAAMSRRGNRVRLRRPDRRRVPALPALAAGLACLLTAAACNNPNLTRRELVVHFDRSATFADHEAARSACKDAAPHASPEPMPSAPPPGVAPGNDVRFRVDHASDRDLNQLLQCLRRQRGVAGFDLPDADG